MNHHVATHHLLAIFVAAALVATSAGTALADSDGEGRACHYTMDDTRNAVVDDAGGRGEAYNYYFDIDVLPSNNRGFCSGCSFGLFAIDLGIDVELLEMAGFGDDAYTSFEAMLAAFEQLASENALALAMNLQPDLDEVDLMALAAQLAPIIVSAGDITDKLEMVGQILAMNFGFDEVEIDDLVAFLGLKQDTAYRADFDNPNDRPDQNTDIAVYELGDVGSALSEKYTDDTVDEILSTLSSLPGLGGQIEISGDDDDVLEPVGFHGVRTGLNVEFRSYTIAGFNTMLLEFKVKNKTTKVFPMVQAAFFADFDIPPGSSDLETHYDEMINAVMVHDELPYEDPVPHYWFGIAPAGLGPSGEGTVFANYNLDDQRSLTQGSQSINLKRYRWFLFDPSLSGDQDEREEKADRQGAISLMHAGPFKPGDEFQAFFCYAGARSGSSGAAMTETITTLDACRGAAILLNAVCGDGVLQLGEECDLGVPANVDCNDECEIIECGDERQTADEECDDGNTSNNDGCSSTCRIEFCGDGITQADEACDDGNMSNTDSCLNGCIAAQCGDGFVRRCTPSIDESCYLPCPEGNQYCLRGVFEIADGTSAADEFTDIVETPIQLTIGFDASERMTSVEITGNNLSSFPLENVQIRMANHPFAASVLAPWLQASSDDLTLTLARDIGGVVRVRPFVVGRRDTTVGTTTYTLQLDGTLSGAPVDGGGFPVLANAGISGGGALLRAFDTDGSVLDSATGDYSGEIGSGLPPADAGAEMCDDGNNNNFDDCTILCEPPQCGDTFIHTDMGEQCDGGPECNGDCTLMDQNLCGDGDDDPGEECDDGDLEDFDGCSSICRIEGCGDGIVQPDEMCDDGNTESGDGCNDTCIPETCGDGAPGPDEECDDGSANGEDAACLPNCLLNTCGDGFTLAGVEECDDGNNVPLDGCDEVCSLEVCGDGVLGLGEDCDDGNDIRGDGCSPDCADEVCGDGYFGPNEECDDGNNASGDGCDKDCLLENADACGDGNVGPGEQCDDGNNTGGDGCNPACQLEDIDTCGNGTLDGVEQCDDGNNTGGDGCSRFCSLEGCGDRVQQFGEQCDDGNTADGDGCSANCTLEPTECGNGQHELGEACDGEPGCAPDCTIADDTAVDLGATCNNGMLDFGEECDDGGRIEGDGCDETCQLEAVICGNGITELGEVCDDDNEVDGDGCSSTCQLEAQCGNGEVELAESCDDGNTTSGDGCSERCRLEGSSTPPGDAECGNGEVEEGEECDDGERNGQLGSRCSAVCTLPSGGGGGCCGVLYQQPAPTHGPLLLTLLGLLLVARLGRPGT